MIHYPELKNNSAGLRAEAHEDINLITLLIGTEQEVWKFIIKKKSGYQLMLGQIKLFVM